jgi:hypothetical protein
MTIHEQDTFTRAYIECALWSSTDDNDKPYDSNDAELADETIVKMAADCKDFQDANAAVLERWYSEAAETFERAGHDFWLTRNGHGAGYWDRWNDGTPQGKIGRELTDLAHAYGSCDLYTGDDGRIYAL